MDEFEKRAAKAHDFEGNLTGYFIGADDWRLIRALIDPPLRISPPPNPGVYSKNTSRRPPSLPGATP